MKQLVLTACSLALILSLLGLRSRVIAQGNNCGNGLVQRLIPGQQGWVNPAPPAQSVRIRQMPGADQIATLKPGDTFIVIDGPQCFDQQSWFEIQTTNGTEGWIAEGVEAGEYFVEPHGRVTSASVIEVNHTGCVSPAALAVGKDASLTLDTGADKLFYGQPDLQGAFFSLANYFENGADQFLKEALLPLSADHPYLITDGPKCVNGNNYWQIRGTYWFWIDERYLQLSSNQPLVNPVYMPHTLNLTKPTDAPLISPDMQVAYNGAAGGGAIPNFSLVDDTCQAFGDIVPDSYSASCFAIYPFVPGEQVDISIVQTDGMSIYKSSLAAAPIDLKIDTGNRTITIPTSGIRIAVPTKLGITSGIYVIKAVGKSETRQFAYEFQENYTTSAFVNYNKQPVLASYCDGSHPILLGTNLEKNSDNELVYLEKVADSTNDGGFSGTYTFRELYRWNIAAGDHGEFLATIGLDLPDGYFVLADENGDWQSNFQIKPGFFGDYAPLAESLASNCEKYGAFIPDFTITSAVTAPSDRTLAYATLYSDTLSKIAQWTFSGNRGDSVSIAVKSDNFDAIMELRDTDGTLLTQDDDSGDRTDAFLQGFQLPAQETYTVIIRSWGDKPGTYTIQLDLHMPQTAGESTPEANAFTPTSISAAATPTSATETTAAEICVGAPASHLALRMTAIQALNQNPVRVRAEPQSGTTIQFLLYPGQSVTIIDGPVCNKLDTSAASLLWWQIETSDGLKGWVTEGTPDQYFLTPKQ